MRQPKQTALKKLVIEYFSRKSDYTLHTAAVRSSRGAISAMYTQERDAEIRIVLWTGKV
jgi:hypothetical protein